MKTIAVILSFLALTTVFANNNNEEKPKSFSITGKVVNNSESLTGVKVILDGKETTVYTDFDGNFTINDVLEGNHTLSFSLVAHNNKVVNVNPSRNNSLQIELQEK